MQEHVSLLRRWRLGHVGKIANLAIRGSFPLMKKATRSLLSGLALFVAPSALLAQMSERGKRAPSRSLRLCIEPQLYVGEILCPSFKGAG